MPVGLARSDRTSRALTLGERGHRAFELHAHADGAGLLAEAEAHHCGGAMGRSMQKVQVRRPFDKTLVPTGPARQVTARVPSRK